MIPGYVADLLKRMSSDEKLPQSGPFPSSMDTVAFQAYREAKGLDNPGILSQVEAAIASAREARAFRDLAHILAGLQKNAPTGEAARLYRKLLERAPADSETVMYLLQGIREGRFRECRDFVLRRLENPDELYLDEIIQYFEDLGERGDVPLVGALLDADCRGNAHPMYCVFALEKMGFPEGVPYLERAVARHAKARKQDLRETRTYALDALAKLRGGSPP
jgi:hypothetical protein